MSHPLANAVSLILPMLIVLGMFLWYTWFRFLSPRDRVDAALCVVAVLILAVGYPWWASSPNCLETTALPWLKC